MQEKQETRVQSPGGKEPPEEGKVAHLQYFLEEEMATHSSVLPWIIP